MTRFTVTIKNFIKATNKVSKPNRYVYDTEPTLSHIMRLSNVNKFTKVNKLNNLSNKTYDNRSALAYIMKHYKN
jgi:hypothetical protein